MRSEDNVRFEGSAVLITGGGAGIGLETARAFLAEGARVTITGRSAERLEAAVASLAGAGGAGGVEGTAGAWGRIAAVVSDIATVAGCRRAVEGALEAHGRLDIVFTCAGNYDTLPIEEMTEELWDQTMATHLKGTFFTVQVALPALRAARGSVITMASDAGLLGLRGGWAAYCAAKGGIVNLTRQLAIDLAPEVRVNGVAPGPVGTEHLYADLAGATYGGFEGATDPAAALAATVPLRQIIPPAEIARAVLYLAEATSMTGAIVSVDGGTSIALP